MSLVYFRRGILPIAHKVLLQEAQGWLNETINTIALPFTFFLAFGLGLKGYISNVEGVSYMAFLTPGLITMTIVGSFQTVGTLLVFGLLVGPPATAALLVRRVPTMMAAAALIGLGSVVVGLIASYHLDTSGSATMAIVPVLLFFAVLSIKARSAPAGGQTLRRGRRSSRPRRERSGRRWRR